MILAYCCSNVNSYSTVPESNKPNLPDRTMDLPFFFRYKHLIETFRAGFRATLQPRLF